MYGKEVYLKFIYKLFLVHPPVENEIYDDNEEMRWRNKSVMLINYERGACMREREKSTIKMKKVQSRWEN